MPPFHPTGVPQGAIHTFTLSSNDCVIYKPGMIRDDLDNCLDAAIYTARTYPGDPSNVLVPNSHPGAWTRTITVYVPTQYRTGTEAPFIVAEDGGPTQLYTVLDNLIYQYRLPSMIGIGIGIGIAAGGQDAQGSGRGREYDTVSGDYAAWVEGEVLTCIQQHLDVRLTKHPDGRAMMGIRSSGSAAFTMAWFRPDLYHRVLGYSPTMFNRQWTHDTALSGGAWEYHDRWAGPPIASLDVNGDTVATSDIPDGAPLIPNSPTKPIRCRFEVGDQDLFYPDAPIVDGVHDWTLANAPTVARTLPKALEWVWAGYRAREA